MTDSVTEAPAEAYPINFAPNLGSPLGSGLIRSQAEDFEVEERLGFELSGEGEHAYLWLEKVGANTGWVAQRLAEWLELRLFDVGYAGKKDRHAVTRQWFSCWLPGQQDPDWQAFECEGVTILKAVRHSKKLRRGDHQGNNFRLVIREIAAEPAALLARLEALAEVGFPNYFGRQRFGFGGGNLERAEVLFTYLATQDSLPTDKVLKREGFGKKTREMFVSAARSYIFNQALQAKLNGSESLVDQELVGEALWLYGDAPHRDITIPALAGDLSHWGQGLIMLGVKAMARPLWVKPDKLRWHFEADNLVLSFGLPSSSYATSLLAEILTIEDANLIAQTEKRAT